MNNYDVDIIYKTGETQFDTLYPQTVDDNVILNEAQGVFQGSTVADALIELKQSVPSATRVTQATPTITIDNNGLITASVTQQAGYVQSGTKTVTKQLSTKGAATYTPGTTNQTISTSNVFLTGNQTVKGDPNLIASNIKQGISIFGVNGSFIGSSTIADWRKPRKITVRNNTNYALRFFTMPTSCINEDNIVDFTADYLYPQANNIPANSTTIIKCWGYDFYIVPLVGMQGYQLTLSATPSDSISTNHSSIGYYYGVYGNRYDSATFSIGSKST